MSEIDRIYEAIESLLCVPLAPVIPDVWFCVYGLHSAFDQLALSAVRGVEGGFVSHSSGIEEEAVGFGNQPNLVPAWISHVESPLMVEENLRCARSISSQFTHTSVHPFGLSASLEQSSIFQTPLEH